MGNEWRPEGLPQREFQWKEPWLPPTFDPLRLSDDERRVYSEIYWHQGAASAIKIRQLGADAYPFRPVGSMDRTIRMALKNLSENHLVAIATSTRPPYGVYLVTDATELEAYLTSLRARAMSTLRRYAKLSGLSMAQLMGQLHLELGESI